jgi:hypothetical protein
MNDAIIESVTESFGLRECLLETVQMMSNDFTPSSPI